jgi:hypothetical protein
MRKIPLTQGKVAWVDDRDYTRVSKHKWSADRAKSGLWYAIRNTGSTTERMHRFILGVTDTKILVDHKNGNGLHNQRKNLRRATSQQSQYNKRISKNNTSGIKGVRWEKRHQRWVVDIKVNRKKIYIGEYASLSKAAKARKEAEIELHKTFSLILSRKKA